MTLHHTGVDMPVAQQAQDVLEPRFTIEGPHCNPLHPSLLIRLFHLPIGQALRPAEDRARRPALSCGTGDRVTPSKGLQDGGCRALVGVGEKRGHMPRTETPLGVVHPGPGWLVGPLAHDQAHDQFTVGRHRGVIPHIPRSICCIGLAALLLFFTKLPCSSHARARGVSPCTCWSWNRSACRPVTRTKRATVSLATWTRRAVALTLPPSPRWLIPASALGTGSFVLNKAVPRRSETTAPQLRQRNRRRRSWPYTYRTTRLRAPARRNNWHAALTQAR